MPWPSRGTTQRRADHPTLSLVGEDKGAGGRGSCAGSTRAAFALSLLCGLPEDLDCLKAVSTRHARLKVMYLRVTHEALALGVGSSCV